MTVKTSQRARRQVGPMLHPAQASGGHRVGEWGRPRLQGQRGKTRVGGREDTERPLLTGLRTPTASTRDGR